MTIPNYPKAWLLSFYSKEFYQTVGQSWRGTGLVYLFILLMVCLAISAIQMQKYVDYLVNNFAPAVLAKLPAIEIKQGILSTQANMPYVIKHDKTNERLVVIDTTGKINSLTQAKARMLITDKVVFYKTRLDRIAKFTLQTLAKPSITNADLHKILAYVQHNLIYYLYLASLLFYFVMTSLALCLLSLFAIIAAKQLAIILCYKALFRLTTVALTPVIILSLVASWFNIFLLIPSISFFFLAIAYIYFAVCANKFPQPAADNIL
jgi:hypothetical protein